MAGVGAAKAAPDGEQYTRSLGLREQWSGLTRDVAWPATWRSDGRFHCCKTVEGGFRFVLYDPVTATRSDAFDHERLAAALATITSVPQQALRLPFETFAWAPANDAILVEVASGRLRCSLVDYSCAPAALSGNVRPRGFGVVRDMQVAAHNTPRRSPDGRWEAFADGHDILLRNVSEGSLRRLTSDGRADAFHDPESIAWSPDSRHLAFYCVQPGLGRRVTRVETSPVGGGQPVVHQQLYPRPGDAVDIERPLLVDVDSGRVILVDDPLFRNPYSMSPILWRVDGRGSLSTTCGGATSMSAWWRLMLPVVGREWWRAMTANPWRVGRARGVEGRHRATPGLVHRQWHYRHLFRVGLDGGKPVRLTTLDADHDVAVSPDGDWYVDVYSWVDVTPVMELRSVHGQLVSELEHGKIDGLLDAG